jgi:Domain of unknown function (DUF4440)
MTRIFLFLLIAVGPLRLTAQSVDSVAIRAVIDRETQAYLDRDASKQAACWASQTVLSQRVSLGDGSVVVGDGDHTSLQRGLATCFRQLAEPDKSTFVHTDVHVRIRGEAAFVTFKQTMQHPDTGNPRPTETSQHTRYLEREAGEWRIVHSGVMYAEPPPIPATRAGGSLSQRHD